MGKGYYSLNFRDLAAHNTLFGQMWKEYANADSRYLTQNAFVLCMETVTAVSCSSAWVENYVHLRYG